MLNFNAKYADVRSVLVKVGNKEVRRPVAGLCLLSNREDEEVPEEAAI